MRLCQHCYRPDRLLRRGLCNRCYKKASVRTRYRCDGVNYRLRAEPTEEELAQTIAEQSTRLPDWWETSYAEELVEERNADIPPIRFYRLNEIVPLARDRMRA